MELRDQKHDYTKSFAAQELDTALVCNYFRRLIVGQWRNRRWLIYSGATKEFNQRIKQNKSPHLTWPAVKKSVYGVIHIMFNKDVKYFVLCF